ncbi:MAG: glycosyltransferase family 4 protein [Steroidobacteraceae bacterium]
MRICVVTEHHPLALMGGAEYQTDLLARELSSRAGVCVYYLARSVPSSRTASTLPYEVRRIGSGAGLRRRATFFDAAGLLRALAEIQPSAVYQRGRQSYTGVCAAYAARAAIPFFFHVASDRDVVPYLLPKGLSFNAPFDLLEGVIGRWGVRRAQHVIVQSSKQQQLLREHMERSDAVQIGNFQPLPGALPRKPASPLRVLWVGNIKQLKRPEMFVELAASFVRRTDLEFHMVGRPARTPRFLPLMRSISALANLKFHGELPLEGVNALMAQASFLVNTSDFEGFPNTFIQAWARGAVVVSRVDPCGGMERLEVGYCAADLGELRAVIVALADRPAARAEIAQRAFEFAARHHSMAEGARLAELIVRAAQERTARQSCEA